MIEALQRLLCRSDLVYAGLLTTWETKRWTAGSVERFVEMGLLRHAAAATSIRFDGCDNGCIVTPLIVTHARTGERFGIYGCPEGECGMVHIPLDDLRQWSFDMLATAKAVAKAIDASGKVVEDVPDRLVAMGSVVASDVRRDVFLARGMAWDDARTALADARHLKAAAAPLVLVLADLPEHPIWSDCKPALAVLADMVSLDENGLVVDLSFVIGRPTKPHPDAMESEWLTVTEAGKRMVAEEVIDDLDLPRAKTLASTAASRGQLVTNNEKGRARRIESGSLAKWMFELRKANLAEDIEVVVPMRRRRASR